MSIKDKIVIPHRGMTDAEMDQIGIEIGFACVVVVAVVTAFVIYWSVSGHGVFL